MRNEAFWKWFDESARPRLGLRASTFARMFKHLDGFDRPVTIVETGCARRDAADDDAWAGDGCSTVMFDRYVIERSDGSRLESVDILDEAAEAAIRNCRAVNVVDSQSSTVTVMDSVQFLKECADGWLRTSGRSPTSSTSIRTTTPGRPDPERGAPSRRVDGRPADDPARHPRGGR